MIIDRTIEFFLGVAFNGFAALWLGIMVSAAATVPVVGFVAAIAAGLVVYSVRSAITGEARARIEAAQYA